MKKFLTVLLVIAVMFTFSFSAAFAADQTLTAAEYSQYSAACNCCYVHFQLLKRNG